MKRMEQYFTVKTAAAKLAIHEDTLYQEILQGRIVAIKLATFRSKGKLARWRIAESELLRYVRSKDTNVGPGLETPRQKRAKETPHKNFEQRSAITRLPVPQPINGPKFV